MLPLVLSRDSATTTDYYRTAGILKGLTLAMTRAEKSVVAPSHICVLTPTSLPLASQVVSKWATTTDGYQLGHDAC